jgi:hypothetical protein
LIALAKHRASIGPVSKLRCVAASNIGAGAGLDAVVTGELVNIKQNGVVEDKASRVFVRYLGLIDADRIGPTDDLSNRLEDVGNAAGCADEWIAVLGAADSNAAHQGSARVEVG